MTAWVTAESKRQLPLGPAIGLGTDELPWDLFLKINSRKILQYHRLDVICMTLRIFSGHPLVLSIHEHGVGPVHSRKDGLTSMSPLDPTGWAEVGFLHFGGQEVQFCLHHAQFCLHIDRPALPRPGLWRPPQHRLVRARRVVPRVAAG